MGCTEALEELRINYWQSKRRFIIAPKRKGNLIIV